MRGPLAGVFGAALAALGCGGDGRAPGASSGGPPELPLDPDGCVPGELAVDGACRAAGLPGDAPEPGPRMPVHAGVPEGACGDGFASDGAGGCTARVPSEECSPGWMAVPGDTACRPVAPCGDGPWGDIPVEPGTRYVDAGFDGVSEGSAAAPFTTIQAAVDAAPAGGMIAVAAGDYAEHVSALGKPVRIWGRCPELVHITGVTMADVVAAEDAAGFELHTLSVHGGEVGVALYDAPGSLIDRVWIADTGAPGVYAEGGAVETVVRDSLVEGAHFTAISSVATQLAVERSELRDTQPLLDTARGIDSWVSADGSGALRVDGARVHGVMGIGILAMGNQVDVARTLIADVTESVVERGWGLLVGDDSGHAPSGSVSQTVIRRTTGAALELLGGSLSIDAVTLEQGVAASGSGAAPGLRVLEGLDTLAPAELSMSRSVVRDTIESGVLVYGSDVSLDRVMVQRSLPRPSDGLAGIGVAARPAWEGSAMTSVRMDGCVVEESHDTGLLVSGVTALVRDSIIRDSLPRSNGDGGYGVAVVMSSEVRQPADATLEHAAIERSWGTGIIMIGSRLSLAGVLVRDVYATEVANGAGVIADAGGGSAALAVAGARIQGAAHFGLALGKGASADIEALHVLGVTPGDPLQRGRGVQLDTASASLRWSLVEQVSGIGVAAWSSELWLEGVAVREVTGDSEGFGIAASVHDGGPPAQLDARACVIEGVRSSGVVADASDLRLHSVAVRDVQPDADGAFGRGITVQAGATLDAALASIAQVHDVGICFIDGHGRVADARIDGVASSPDGSSGDGVTVTPTAGTVILERADIAHAARAGITSYGARVELTDCALRCNLIDIDVEPIGDSDARVVDGGGNRCGCESERVCKAVSSGLAPPAPLP